MDGRRERLRIRHRGPGLVTPNPWDARSAWSLESLGYEALATTSSGHAAALGKLDEQVTRELRDEGTLVSLHSRVLDAGGEKMNALRFKIRALATAGVVALALSSVSYAALAQTPSYSRDANDVVISYREILPIKGDQRGPTLRVYGDGRLRVSYPETLTRAGEHELSLDADRLDALVRALARTDRLIEFDARQARERRRAAHAARTAQTGTETVQSDPTAIEIVLRCDGAEKRISWSGLEFDDEHYGASLPEIRRLRAAQLRLRALLEAPELRRVR